MPPNVFLSSALFIFLVNVFSGCSFVSTKKEFQDIQENIESKKKTSVFWHKKADVDEEIKIQIQSILGKQLTVDDAVAVAMLNNPSLQATFEGLGVAKAEAVKGGLLKNPSVSISVREPDHEGKTNKEFEVQQDMLSIITLPLRKRLARAQLEQVKYSIGSVIIQLDQEVRVAYYTLQAAMQMHLMQEKNLKAAEAAAELAQRQFEAGNVNDLFLSGQKIALYQVQMDLIQTKTEVDNARGELARLMGLSGDSENWEIEETLPYLSQEELSLEMLEAKAMAQNFDLAMAREEIKIRERALSLHRVEMLPEVHGGYNKEEETDGAKVSGPVFEVEIPIFDQKNTDLTRAKAQLRQSRQQLKAKEDEIFTEVRRTYSQFMTTRRMVEIYRDSVIPLHAKFVDSLQGHYNYMLVGVYDLLEAKKEEVEIHHKFVESLKEYWIIRSHLERLIGEKIAFSPMDAQMSDTQNQPSDSEHEYHNKAAKEGGNEK